MLIKRISKHFALLLATITVAVGLWSCGGTIKQISAAGHGRLTHAQFLRLYEAQEEYPVVNARGTLSVDAKLGEEQGKQLHLSGLGMRWYLERDKAMELSLRPLSFMEAGRFSVANDKLLLLDRMNKYYYFEGNASRTLGAYISFLGVDARMLESAIQHRPFGLVTYGSESLGRMHFSREEGGYTFKDEIRPGGNNVTLRFDAGLNLLTSLYSVPGQGEFKVTYSDFVVDEQSTSTANMRAIPTQITIEVNSVALPDKYLKLHFSLDKVDTQKQQKVSITPEPGYRSLSLKEIISIISSL